MILAWAWAVPPPEFWLVVMGRNPPGEARASNHPGRGVILGFILPDALPGHRVDSPIKAAHWGSSAPG